MNWVAGYCLVAVFAYWIPHWRHMTQLYSSLLVAYSIFLYATSVESFHYMVLKGDREGVEGWLRRVNYFGRWIGEEEVGIRFEEIKTKPAKRDEESIWHLLLTNRLFLLYNIAMILLFSSDTFVYFGLSIFT